MKLKEFEVTPEWNRLTEQYAEYHPTVLIPTKKPYALQPAELSAENALSELFFKYAEYRICEIFIHDCNNEIVIIIAPEDSLYGVIGLHKWKALNALNHDAYNNTSDVVCKYYLIDEDDYTKALHEKGCEHIAPSRRVELVVREYNDLCASIFVRVFVSSKATVPEEVSKETFFEESVGYDVFDDSWVDMLFSSVSILRRAFRTNHRQDIKFMSAVEIADHISIPIKTGYISDVGLSLREIDSTDRYESFQNYNAVQFMTLMSEKDEKGTHRYLHMSVQRDGFAAAHNILSAYTLIDCGLANNENVSDLPNLESVSVVWVDEKKHCSAPVSIDRVLKDRRLRYSQAMFTVIYTDIEDGNVSNSVTIFGRKFRQIPSMPSLYQFIGTWLLSHSEECNLSPEQFAKDWERLKFVWRNCLDQYSF